MRHATFSAAEISGGGRGKKMPRGFMLLDRNAFNPVGYWDLRFAQKGGSGSIGFFHDLCRTQNLSGANGRVLGGKRMTGFSPPAGSTNLVSASLASSVPALPLVIGVSFEVEPTFSGAVIEANDGISGTSFVDIKSSTTSGITGFVQDPSLATDTVSGPSTVAGDAHHAVFIVRATNSRTLIVDGRVFKSSVSLGALAAITNVAVNGTSSPATQSNRSLVSQAWFDKVDRGDAFYVDWTLRPWQYVAPRRFGAATFVYPYQRYDILAFGGAM